MCQKQKFLLNGKLQESNFFLFKGVPSHAVLRDLHKDTTIQGQALDCVFEGHSCQKVRSHYLTWKLYTDDVSEVHENRFLNSNDLNVMTTRGNDP